MSDPVITRAEKPRRNFLQTVALASLALSVGDTGVQAADGALVALKRDLDAARADIENVIARTAGDTSFEAEQALDEACDRRDDIIVRIGSIPATTLDGAKIKLDALDAIRLIIQILNTLRGL